MASLTGVSPSQAVVPSTAMRDRAIERMPAPRVAIIAVFLSSYLSWRPSFDIMFTASDAFFMISAGYLLLHGRIPAQPFRGLTAYWLFAFVLMMAGLLIASLFDDDPIRWFLVAGQYGFAWIVLPYILMGHGRDYTITLVKALVAGMVVMEVVGALVYFFYQGSFEEGMDLLGHNFLSGSRRLGAFVTDANWNGAATAMALPFAFYLASKRLIRPIWTIVAVAALALGLVLSASFTAFISALFATTVFVLVGVVRPRFRTMIVVAVLATIAYQSGYRLPATFERRVASAFEAGDVSQAGTYEGRVALIEEAWDIVDDHVVVGVGVDQYRNVSYFGQPVHNMYLLVWAEGGLLALVGWLGMVAVLFISALMPFRQDRLAAALAGSVLATFIIFSTASPHMYARLWAVPVLLAMAVAVRAAGEFVPQARRRASGLK